MGRFDTVYNVVNGSLSNANIASDAAISKSKLDLTDVGSITFIIGDNQTELSTGVAGYLEIPFACTINRVTMLADQTGSCVVDIWKDTYANYPPTDADTITASAVPTITTALKSQDSSLTGWTTSVSAGDVIGFNVDSVTDITQVTISLKITKS